MLLGRPFIFIPPSPSLSNLMTNSNGKAFANGTHSSVSPTNTLVSEASIEKYVRFGVMLTQEEKLKIEECLERDAALKSVAEFYRSFYEAYDELEDQSTEKVDDFMISLFS